MQDYESLRSAGQDLADAHHALQTRVGDLLKEVKEFEAARDDAAICLFRAQSLETAKRWLE